MLVHLRGLRLVVRDRQEVPELFFHSRTGEKLMYRLWLDDMRPAPDGWLWVKNIEDAKRYLAAGQVECASLDHDLGACATCMNGCTPEQWLESTGYRSMPNCEHFGTGYQLVCWMEETGHWPLDKPRVHSANPAGRARMQQAIDREWQRRAEHGISRDASK